MKKRLVVGIVLLLISYIQFFIPIKIFKQYLHPFFSLVLMTGFILILDAITYHFYKKSLLSKLLKNRKNIFVFILITIIGTTFLELFAHWLGKLWIYPYWNFFDYFIFFIPGFIVYWLFICESYLATKSIIDYLHRGKTFIKKPFKEEKGFFKILGVIGIGILITSIILTYIDYSNQDVVLVSLEDLDKVTSSYVAPYYIMIMFVLSFWFILEYIEYKRKKSSLIKDIMHDYLTPLGAIIIGSMFFAIILESHNILYKWWVYINWPFQEITFIGLPIMMFFAWPLHYIVFLSLWRAFTDKESSEVWKGDLVK